MIELPEARTISKDLRNEIVGKKIVDVRGNFTDHKFTFYYKDPTKYKDLLIGKKITNIVDRNFYIEIEAEDIKITMRDGSNIRFYDNRQDFPEKSKLLIEFNDGSFINVTTSMYAAIFVFNKDEDIKNKYYDLEITGIGAVDKNFTYDYFKSLITVETKKLSIKAFLATEQRILGIGNGVVQDIMFNAELHPKRKINTLDNNELEHLYKSIVGTINNMIDLGGRDTEKNIYGEFGRYKTKLSSKTYKNGCPVCGNNIKKENYLGGSIYFCSNCQK